MKLLIKEGRGLYYNEKELSNTELLSLIVGEVDSKKLMDSFVSIEDIINANKSEIQSISDKIVANRIQAVKELFNRLEYGNKEQIVNKIRSPNDIYYHCRDMELLDHEEVRLIMMNSRNKVIGNETIHRGSVNVSVLSPHTVMRTALLNNAVSVALVHNHPGGDPKPSFADIEATKQIMSACKACEITLHDHIVIGNMGFWSMRDERQI